MSEFLNPEQPSQNIFSNVSAENITTGDITQIYKIVVNLDQIPKPQGIPQNIASSSTDKFVGRERDLDNLNQQLQRNNQVVIAAVEGMGGVGKTELAIQYSLLNLQLDTYPGGICWIRAREQDIGLQIVNFARTDLDLNPPDDLELPDRVRWCWKRWREGNTLIVLDDVKDYSDIKPYLPPQPSQFKVLITTRLKLDLPSSMYLAVLSESDALGLLGQLAGSEKVEQELEIAKELCQRLGYLPLALQLVGRYVKKHRISLSEELRRLEEKGLGHPSMEVPENDPSWTLDIKRGVEAAFELSWDELKKSEVAQELGCLLSLFALAPIPWSLVESAAEGHDSEELEDARVELENLHLLQGEDIYQLHHLIQEFLRDKQKNLTNTDEQKSNLCTAIVIIAKEIDQRVTLSERNQFIPFISHIAEAATFHQNWLSEEDLITPFTGLGRFYQSQGAYTKALSWYEQSIIVAKNCLGEEHPDVAKSLNNLALLYRLQGKYLDAESLYLQALELSKKLLGEKHPDVATLINNLALLYKSQGRYSDAEPLYLQALEIRKNLLGEEHPDVAKSLNNLALLYKSQGRYSDAEPLYSKSLELNKKLLGEEHPVVALNLDNLAGLYNSQGKYSEAESLCLEALELRKKLLGEEHPDVAQSLNNLALLYKLQRKYLDAESLYLQALELRKKLLGEEHPDVAISLNNLAELYFAQERYSEAEPLYLQALELRKKLLGEKHPDVAISLDNLAKLYCSQKRYSESEFLHLQALERLKKLLGEEHPDVAISLNNLAMLYYSQQRYSKSEPLCLQALIIAEKVLGKEHPKTNIFRENYDKLSRMIK